MSSTPPPPPPARPVDPTPPPQPGPAAPAAPPPPPPTAPPAPASAASDDDLASLLSQISDDGQVAAPAVGAALTKPTDVERPEKAEAVRIESQGGIEFDPDLASYPARFGGLLIDNVIVALCLLPGILVAASGSALLIVGGIVLMIAGFALAAVSYARAVSRTGQWIGNRVTRTKVVDARTGRAITTGDAGVRFVLRYFVSSILYIGFLIALFDSQRQTFHDRFVGTVVTRPPLATWSADDEVVDG